MTTQENKISFTDYVKANTDQDQFKIIDDVKNTPTLKEAQDFVGGNVECIGWPNGDLLIVNEKGKLMGLPENEEATDLWWKELEKQNKSTLDYLAGNVLVLTGKARMT